MSLKLIEISERCEILKIFIFRNNCALPVKSGCEENKQNDHNQEVVATESSSLAKRSRVDEVLKPSSIQPQNKTVLIFTY